jgi:hypothetical protein
VTDASPAALLIEANKAETAAEAANRLDALTHGPYDLDLPEIEQPLSDVLWKLQRSTLDSPRTAVGIITTLIIPLVFHTGRGRARRILTRSLRAWLDEFPPGVRLGAERTVAGYVMDNCPPEGAELEIDLLRLLGVRTTKVVERLWFVATEHPDTEAGDLARAALASWGLDKSGTARMARQLRERIGKGEPSIVGAAIVGLGVPDLLANTFDEYLVKEPDGTSDYEADRFIRLASSIADQHGSEVGLQAFAFETALGLARQGSESARFSLLLGGDVAPHCDWGRVPAAFFSWMRGDLGDPGAGVGANRWRAYLRLRDCVRPRQLAGWRFAGPLPNALKEDALRDTLVEFTSQTEFGLAKEEAWRMAVMNGDLGFLDWFYPGVSEEKSPYIQQSAIHVLACFRNGMVPDLACKWVTDRLDFDPAIGGHEFPRRDAAIRLLWSWPCWKGFRALARFGFTYRGLVGYDSINALSSVSYELAKKQPTRVVRQLLAIITDPRAEQHWRLVASEALATLAGARLVPRKCVDEIEGLPTDPRLGRNDQMRCFRAVIDLPSESVRSDTIGAAWGALSDTSMKSDLRVEAALVVAVHRPRELSRLMQAFGLRGLDSQPSVGRQTMPELAWLAGYAYRKRPSLYAPAIESLIRDENDAIRSYALEAVRNAHLRRPRLKLPLSLALAISEAAQGRGTGHDWPGQAISVLAEIAPSVLAGVDWASALSEWRPDIKLLLANALGSAARVRPAAKENGLNWLLTLVREGDYQVRRAALRGIGGISQHTLRSAIGTWAVADDVDLRIRAAEACAWIDFNDAPDLPEFRRETADLLFMDQSSLVRVAFRRSWMESRNRHWADDYLKKLAEVDPASNVSIAANWKYAEALIRLGDDETARRVDRLAQRELPAHATFWLRSVAKQVDEAWKKAKSNWPAPIPYWTGGLGVDHLFKFQRRQANG